MIKKIIDQLNASKATDWKLTETIVDSQEYFFVKNKMDIGRAKKVHHFEATVYVDFTEGSEKYRGSSSLSLSPLLNTNELTEAIEGAVFAASFVKNPWYPIAEAYSKVFPFQKIDLKKLEKETLAAIINAQSHTKAWINSSELFVSEIQTRILNSNGLDCSYCKYQTYLETIVSAAGKEEVELYDDYQLSIPDSVLIGNRISELLKLVTERSLAQPTPSLKEIPVLLTGEPAKEFLRYYLEQANAKMKYDKMSEAEIGKAVQGNQSGDSISLDIVSQLDNSYYGAPVDDDGFLIHSQRIIENGLLKNFWGDLRYSYYLGVELTGSAENFKVCPGKASVEELRNQPHLEVSHFSAVDADMTTGDFGGEIRLGWYYDGNKRIPVSGGSVTGNIREISSMKLSKDVHLEGDFFGPTSILIEGFNISGE